MIRLVGILNITPDSFSDGGKFMAQGAAFLRAEEMLDDGVHVLDIGGDSTRPGSVCVSAVEEWRRIGGVVSLLSAHVPVSVDTHIALTARLALQNGAVMINDVSAGQDPEMFEVLSKFSAKIVLMHSCCPQPHVFPSDCPAGDIVARARDFLAERMESAVRAGIAKDNIILDPGSGAFISRDPKVCRQLLEHFTEFEGLGCPLMLGVSRKSFLKEAGEKDIKERDSISAAVAVQVIERLALKKPLYLRVHNVKLHIQTLEKAGLPLDSH